MAELKLRLFGGFQARFSSGRSVELTTRKARALLAYLALHAGQAQSREKLISLLWSDRAEKQGRDSLRQALTALRRGLGSEGAALLTVNGDAIAVEPSAVEVDASSFEQLLASGAPEELERAVALYQGDFLDGIGVRDPAFEDWMYAERERLHGRAVEALAKVLAHQAESGAADRAMATAARVLQLDPLQEMAHRALMRLHAERGQRGLALRQYQACVDVLKRELGIAPEPETVALHDAIRQARGLLSGSKLELARSAEKEHTDDLARAPPAIGPLAQRRHLTIVFVDVVGSMELSTQLDPEQMRDLLKDYQKSVAKEVARFEGHVTNVMGDEVLVYFGWPHAHEDDAERAIRASLAVRASAGALRRPEDHPLAVRIGIASGLIVVGEGTGPDAAGVGETPNLASRLRALASPDQIIIAESTRRLLPDIFELADLGTKSVRGIREPVRAFAVTGDRPVESRFDARQTGGLTPLVGREEEIALLLRRWRQASDGEGQVVLLSGEPGIGKSRLVRELRGRLADERHLRLTCQCSPHHTTSPLHPLLEQLERAAGFERDDSSEARLDKLETLLSRGTERLDEAVPLVAAVLGLPGGNRYPLPQLTPQRQKQLTLEALVDQLGGLSAGQPVLAVYEDVHWVDPTTLELLGLLIERVQRLPVLVLITFRPEFSPPWTGHAHVMQLSLSRLTRRHGQALVEEVTGGKALPFELVEQILRKTDGVPLFVEELTKTVLETGLVTDAGDHYALSGPLPPLAIPATLHDSLMARLDRLTPVKEIAQISAVIGREFSHELIAAIADRPEHQLSAALSTLVKSELVFRRGTPPDATYSFKHALVQDAAYQSLLKSRRQELHAKIAAVLEARVEDAQKEPELLAYHYRQAGLLESAIPYAIRAGDVAFGRFALVEARARYEEAVDMAQALAPSEQTSRLQIRAMLKLANIYQLLGEYGHMPPNEAYPKAKRAATKVLELDPASAEAYYVLALVLGLYDWDWAGSENAYKKAIELNPSSVLAHQHYGILLLAPLGRHGEAISELKRALELDPLIPWTGADLAGALRNAGRYDQAIEQSRDTIGLDSTFPQSHRTLGLTYVELGRYEEALAELRKTVELTGGEVHALSQLGWAYGVAGRKDETQRVLNELMSRAEREHIDPLAFAWLNIGLGDKEAAFSWLERAYKAKSSWLIFLKVHQIYEPLRADPRYCDLLRRLGLESQESGACPCS